jgi:hypothetical protein
VQRPVRQLVERDRVHRRQLGKTGRSRRRSPDWTGQSVGRSVLVERLVGSGLSSRPGSDNGQATTRGSWPETRDRRGGPEVDVIDPLKESLSDQRVKCFSAIAFVERPEPTGLWQGQRDSGVLLELAADSSE